MRTRRFPLLPAISVEAAPGLNNLEKLGAFLTSQIHDLNNQMSVLANAELLLEISDLPVSAELKPFLGGLFGSIRRLSASCEQLNLARKTFPIAINGVPMSEAMEVAKTTAKALGGWTIKERGPKSSLVLLNPAWLAPIVQSLIGRLRCQEGVLTLSTGELPPRHYLYSMRTPSGRVGEAAFLVHFVGIQAQPDPGLVESSGISDFQIALELVRLMGGGLSLGLSDDQQDILLAFPLKPKPEPRRSIRIARRSL